MRQFQVPQFITFEDKVIGGVLTIRQFLYLAAGAGIIFLARFLFESFVWVPLGVVAGALAAGLAFVKINEQPLPSMIKNMIFYYVRPRLYIWKKAAPPRRQPLKEALERPTSPITAIPKLSQSKLSDLAWSLDIKERFR